MSVVVTGSSGHVGANLVRALLAQGRTTHLFVHRDRRAIEGLDVSFTEGDVRDLPSVVQAFRGAEVVFHLAAYISIRSDEWSSCQSVNIAGTRNVVEACLRCGVRRLVHFSSIHAIATPPGQNEANEESALAQSAHCAPYDRSKAAAELEVRHGISKGLDAVIISPTAVIGPFDYKPSFFGEALLKLTSGKLPAMITGGFDWVDVRDVVNGAMTAEKVASAGAKYILSGHWASMRDIAASVEDITGVPMPGFNCPAWLAEAGAPFLTAIDRLLGRRPLYTPVSLRTLRGHRNVSHEKATCELGYTPRPLKETLADTLEWFEKNGRLKRPSKYRLIEKTRL